MKAFVSILLGLALCATPLAATADDDQYGAGCLLTKLDPNGDGFLSIRRGPSSKQAEIARVRNGDTLFFDHRTCKGKWCFAEEGIVKGNRTNVNGWFYTAWCEIYP
ncbi:hypothetical protein [Oceaniglobus indicus]|uniref:hypothetical protein n=1 Tax=Oceaniglobus indicus TaxID=2047749 RepID=UPI001F4E47DF|nr:hypothetical protein [Oceaniglobus indicus]